MNELSSQNNDLQLMNTPLQNLKNILSDVDATVQLIPNARNTSEERPRLYERNSQEVNKLEVKKLIERITADSKQFLLPEMLDNALNELRPTVERIDVIVTGRFLENIHIKTLDNIFRKAQDNAF